jgi:hypothetical protein
MVLNGDGSRAFILLFKERNYGRDTDLKIVLMPPASDWYQSSEDSERVDGR